ncbi:MAG: hypothetical protein GEV09_18080 [Pseudonocardiaceae bacterium]|nr:hypothetical protein [Pseudonocardiaceae bacterium]
MTRSGSATKRLGTAVAVGLLIAAVVTELRLPREQRTWQGRVAGVVPYDLRPPTARRIRETVWNPANERVFVPHAFGVGWTVNVGYVARCLREARDR